MTWFVAMLDNAIRQRLCPTKLLNWVAPQLIVVMLLNPIPMAPFPGEGGDNELGCFAGASRLQNTPHLPSLNREGWGWGTDGNAHG